MRIGLSESGGDGDGFWQGLGEFEARVVGIFLGEGVAGLADEDDVTDVVRF